MRKLTLIIAATSIVCATSCNNSPDADKAQAGAAIEAGEATGKELTADPAATKIEWIGSKPIGSQHTGTIGLKEGKLVVDNGNITGGKFLFDFTTLTPVDQDSTGNAKLRGHLLSPDFLDVDQFPDGSFEITSVTEGVDTANVTYKEATHNVTGNLTLKGVSKSISFPARIEQNDNNVVTHAVFNIDRTDWNINYNSDASIKDKFINKEINITLHLVANK